MPKVFAPRALETRDLLPNTVQVCRRTWLGVAAALVLPVLLFLWGGYVNTSNAPDRMVS